MTLFEKIAAREIPARIVSETAEWIAFHDVNPQAPVHVLIVPKRAIPRLDQAADEDAALLGRMLLAAPQIRIEKAGGAGEDTLHARGERQRSERQALAEQHFRADPVVGRLLEQGATIVPGSIRPLD